MPPYKKREWVSQNEWRRRKAAKKKHWQEYLRLKEEEKGERLREYEAGEAIRRLKTNTLSAKLWSWGVNSKKYPTYSLGLFPSALMLIVGVPVLGILYKLSLTWLGLPMIFAAMVVERGWKKFSSRRKRS